MSTGAHEVQNVVSYEFELHVLAEVNILDILKHVLFDGLILNGFDIFEVFHLKIIKISATSIKSSFPDEHGNDGVHALWEVFLEHDLALLGEAH